MIKPIAFTLAALLSFAGAHAQDDPKAEAEKKKQEEKAKEEEAKKVVEAFKKEFAKAKNAGEMASAIENNLKDVVPHAIIRTQLQQLIANANPDVRIAAVEALGSSKWKGDKDAATILYNTANGTPIKDLDFKVKCIYRFGKVAPFSMATKLKPWFESESIEIVKEAVDAAKEINSLRIQRDLIALLGKLDAIREDKKKNDQSGGSYGPPPPGVPSGTPQSNQADEKIKMKKEVTPVVMSAINQLWKKYDDKLKTNSYVEANKAMSKNDPFIKKVVEQEDKEEKGILPEDGK